MRRNYVRLLPVLLLSLLSGCSLTPQSYHDKALQDTLAQWHLMQTNAKNLTYITDLVQDKRLSLLIKEALANNPTLKQTLITLKQTYTSYDITNSARLPDIETDFSGSKTESSDPSYSADISVSWELDLWRKLSDSSTAAKLNIQSSTLAYQEAKDILAANVMRYWLNILLNQQLVDVQQQRVTLLSSNKNLILNEYQSGLGNLDDLDSANSTLQKAQSTLQGYKQDLVIAERKLHLLLGHTEQNTSFNFNHQFPTILQPLASFPKQDLARRPDLQQAYLDIQEKEYSAKASYKELLPSISLTASYADSGLSPSEALFRNPLWTLLGQLTAPIFNGGKLRAQAKSADLDTAKSYYVYQETLLTAINEVENYLDNETSYAQQEQYLQQALYSGERSMQNYKEEYRQGLGTIYELITAQTNVMDLKVSLLNKKYARLNNRIDLGLALGLGVQNENK